MSVTSTSQIFNAKAVGDTTVYIGNAINYLKEAKKGLNNSKSYCGKNAFVTNEGNKYPAKIDQINSAIDDAINNLDSLADNIVAKANQMNKSDTNEYNEYVRNKEKQKEN